MAETFEVRAPDGRVLLTAETGPRDGLAVLFHHGWPGCHLLPPGFAEAAAAHGVRLVSFDRAGYGRSSPQPRRRIADAAADAAAVADALGIARFGVWGVSGGGPHALACAALLPDRVVAAVSVSGFAPIDTPGLDFTAGMGEASQDEFAAARAGGAAYESLVRRNVEATLATSRDRVADAWDTLLAPPDLRLLAGDPAIGDYLLASCQAALRAGIDGWIEDGLATVAPWGFDLSSIRAPVLLLQGVHDLMVPPAHVHALAAALPQATVVLERDEGHLTLCFEAERPLAFLTEAGRERGRRASSSTA